MAINCGGIAYVVTRPRLDLLVRRVPHLHRAEGAVPAVDRPFMQRLRLAGDCRLPLVRMIRVELRRFTRRHGNLPCLVVA